MTERRDRRAECRFGRNAAEWVGVERGVGFLFAEDRGEGKISGVGASGVAAESELRAPLLSGESEWVRGIGFGSNLAESGAGTFLTEGMR